MGRIAEILTNNHSWWKNSHPWWEVERKFFNNIKPESSALNQALLSPEDWIQTIKQIASFNYLPQIEMGRVGRKKAALYAFFPKERRALVVCIEDFLEAIKTFNKLAPEITDIKVSSQTFPNKFDRTIDITVPKFLPPQLEENDSIELTRQRARITAGFIKRALLESETFHVARTIETKNCRIKLLSIPLVYDLVKSYDLENREDRVSVAIKKMRLVEAIKRK